jgi:mRNA interferase MazF
MKRGDVYLMRKPSSTDPKRRRAFVVVSRQILIDSNYSSVICAPVYSKHSGLVTQISVGETEGLNRESAVHCDGLVSLPKSMLTHYIGTLSEAKLLELADSLRIALAIET